MGLTEISLVEFWNRLVSLEVRTRAIERRFGTLQLYALQRTRIFYALANAVGLFDDPHPHFTKPAPVEGELPRGWRKLVPEAQDVIVPFRRRVAGAEPYSDSIVAKLLKESESIRVLDFNLPSEPSSASKGIIPELNLELLRRQFAVDEAKAVERIMRFTSRRPQVHGWQKLISEFEAEFGVSLEKFKKYPQWFVRRTLAEQRGFEKLFRQMKTKSLYIVNAYSEPSIVLGARRAGVKVHEIQHGFISQLHPAYSFGPVTQSEYIAESLAHNDAKNKPTRKKIGPRLDASPDELLTWGTFWGSDVVLPRGTKLRVTGATLPFEIYRTLALSENRIINKQVLFSSQGAIANQLFKAAYETALKLPDYTIIYRLHPNESLADFETLLEKQNRLTEASGGQPPKNLQLSHRHPIFLDLVSQSEYLIGAFSTTLYEGLALGCKVLVLPIAGVENVRPAIAAGDITLITSLDEISTALLSARKAVNPEKYYARDENA